MLRMAFPVLSLLLVCIGGASRADDLDQVTAKAMAACLDFVLKEDDSALKAGYFLPEDQLQEIKNAATIGMTPKTLRYEDGIHNLAIFASASVFSRRDCAVTQKVSDRTLAIAPDFFQEQRNGLIELSADDMRAELTNWGNEYSNSYGFLAWPEAVERELIGIEKRNNAFAYRRCGKNSAAILIAKTGKDGEGEFWHVKLESFLFEVDDETEDARDQVEVANMICPMGMANPISRPQRDPSAG